MKKRTAIIVLIIMFAAKVGLGYLDYPVIRDTVNTPGQGESIKLGLDLAGGVSITYQATGDEDPRLRCIRRDRSVSI